MLDQSNPFTALRLVSWIVWKIPSRRPMKMAGFSHTEAGSSLDMMDAAEEASLPDLREVLCHALDEFRHARLFAERSLALSQNARAADVLEDPEYTASHGIRGEASLYKRLGETEFSCLRVAARASRCTSIRDLFRADEAGPNFLGHVRGNLPG